MSIRPLLPHQLYATRWRRLDPIINNQSATQRPGLATTMFVLPEPPIIMQGRRNPMLLIVRAAIAEQASDMKPHAARHLDLLTNNQPATQHLALATIMPVLLEPPIVMQGHRSPMLLTVRAAIVERANDLKPHAARHRGEAIDRPDRVTTSIVLLAIGPRAFGRSSDMLAEPAVTESHRLVWEKSGRFF